MERSSGDNQRGVFDSGEEPSVHSYEVLRAAVAQKGVKALSGHLQLSQSLLYKWCQPKAEEGGDGVENPLDRLLALMQFSEDLTPLHWLCQACAGFYVANPIQSSDKISPVLQATQKLLREFSELLEIISRSYNDDAAISDIEASRIRAEWERLKSLGEGFVAACEEGDYAGPNTQKGSL